MAAVVEVVAFSVAYASFVQHVVADADYDAGGFVFAVVVYVGAVASFVDASFVVVGPF